MKGTKLVYFLLILIIFSNCKKDSNNENETSLLKEGFYSLHTTNQSGTDSYFNYYVKNNYLHTINREKICFERYAGEIKINQIITLPSLHFYDPYDSSTCAFINDRYGGDTLVFSFSNISEYLDNNSNSAIKGEFKMLLIKRLHGVSEQFGSFELGYKKYQRM